MRSQQSQKFPILEDMDDLPIPESRKIKRIYVHHSWSRFGDAEEIDAWHRDRKFREIGYNAVVNPGEKRVRRDVGFPAGIIQVGRSVNKTPATVRGDNSRSIGICVVGNFDLKDENKKPGEKPDPAGAREKALGLMVATYCKKLNLPVRQVLGHREAEFVPGVPDPGKSCPGDNIDCDLMRGFIWEILNVRYHKFYDWYVELVETFRAQHPGYKFTS